MSEPTCAVYYWSYGELFVSLFETEQEAAEAAESMDQSETGSTHGIQFADGTFIAREHWEAYEAIERRRYCEVVRQSKEAPPPPRRHQVTPPFDSRGQQAIIEGDAPSWLGRARELMEESEWG